MGLARSDRSERLRKGVSGTRSPVGQGVHDNSWLSVRGSGRRRWRSLRRSSPGSTGTAVEAPATPGAVGSVSRNGMQEARGVQVRE